MLQIIRKPHIPEKIINKMDERCKWKKSDYVGSEKVKTTNVESATYAENYKKKERETVVV